MLTRESIPLSWRFDPLPAEPYDTVEATLRIDALGESEAARRSYRAKGIFLRGSTYEPITVTPRECFSCLPPAGNAQRDAGCSQSVFARGRREAPGRDAAGGDGSCFGNCHPEFSYLRRFTSAGCIGLHTSLWAMFLFRMLQKLKWSRRVSAACSMGFVLFFMGLAGFSPSVTRAGS